MGTEACASGAAVGVADLLRLQTAVLWHRDFAQAAAALATALCDRLRCDRVALGWIRADSRAVCTVLLVDAAKPVGALTFERASVPFTPEEVALCEDAAALAAPILS